jgi:hypothetical protein
MQKLIVSFLLVAGLYTAAGAQTTIQDSQAEKRDVGSFHGIEVSTGIQLLLTHGNSEDVAVSAAEPDYRDKIVTKVEKGILKIYYDSKIGAINRRHEDKRLKAYVSYKMLDVLRVNTGAEVKIDGQLSTNYLDLDASTGAEIYGQINIGTLKINQSTGSKITFSGKAEKLEADGDTGSKFLGEDLEVSTCSVEVSTGAGIYITVQKDLSVKASTGGYVKYKGTAGIKTIKANTGGFVTRI